MDEIEKTFFFLFDLKSYGTAKNRNIIYTPPPLRPYPFSKLGYRFGSLTLSLHFFEALEKQYFLTRYFLAILKKITRNQQFS
jgi:hypothetical protein